MALSINSNIAALSVQRYLARSTNNLSINYNRLASGLRINSSKDDPAGLSISTRLTANIRGMNQAITNANDGLSLTQIADEALSQTVEALQQIREKAVEANTSSLTNTDRNDLNTEVMQLVAEIDRIGNNTDFNNQILLSGGFTNKKFQIGTDAMQTIQISIMGAVNSAIGLGVGGTLANVSTMANASTTIGLVDTALDSVTSIRSQLGAFQNRFESIISSLTSGSENLQIARSHIMDVDVAQEATLLARNSIIQQAGIAILAQANLQPKQVLNLLQ
ncbi:MAG: flagellin FliC [Magnetococcus sp. DMHC-6]